MHPLIPLSVGIAAVTLYLLSFQLKKRRSIIIVNTVSKLLYIIQYCLLGAFSGAVLDVIGALAGVVSERAESGFLKRHLRLIGVGFSLLTVAAGLLLYENIFSLFPIVAVVLQIIAILSVREKSIRIITLASTPFWFTYNLTSRAYGSVIGDISTAVSIVISLVRYRKRPGSGEELSDELSDISVSPDAE